jgi:hypothetical protein
VECLAAIDAWIAGAISAEANPAPVVQSSAVTASVSTHFMLVGSRRWAQLVRLMAISWETFREFPEFFTRRYSRGYRTFHSAPD